MVGTPDLTPAVKVVVPPRVPVAAIVLLLLGTVLIGCSVATKNNHCWIASVPFFLTGCAAYLARPRGVEFELRPNGIFLPAGHRLLSFEDFQTVYFWGQRADAQLDIVFRSETLTLPGGTAANNFEVYQFLSIWLPRSGSRALLADRGKHLRELIETFGDDRVFSYSARPELVPSQTYRMSRAITIALFLSGIVWVFIAALLGRGYDGWYAGGIIAFLAFLTGLLSATNRRQRLQRIGKWRQSAMIISPRGIALWQGDLQGELKWSELRNVRFTPGGKSMAEYYSHPRHLLALEVEGAVINIPDIYDRPLPAMHRQIQTYWQGGR